MANANADVNPKNFYELAESGATSAPHNDDGKKLVTIFNIKKKEGGGLELGDMRAVIAENRQINKDELEKGVSPQELAVNLMTAGAKGKLLGEDNTITGGTIVAQRQGEADPDAAVDFRATDMVEGADNAKIFTAIEGFNYASDASQAAAAVEDVNFVTGEKGTIIKNRAIFEIYKNDQAGKVENTKLTVNNVGNLNTLLGSKVTIDGDAENTGRKRTFTGGRRARSKSAKRKSKRGGRRRKRKSAKRKH